MSGLLSDTAVIQQVLDHIDNNTTEVCDEEWKEPVENYISELRFEEEVRLLKHLPIPFCPSAALPETGSYIARTAAGTPLVVVRDQNGEVRGFRNACRHRGMQVAQGSGTTKVFVCGYHGWAYGLTGQLQHVPHEYGFPDLDRDNHGLVPVDVTERHGLVFVTQEDPVSEGMFNGLEDIPDLLSPDQKIFATGESELDVNWKLIMEGMLEGYHIKPTHPESFYPYGFDNLNVVESFGNNGRVTYPFRRIEKLRDVEEADRNIAGLVTYVYQLFPNVTVAVLSNHTTVSISEPLSPGRTRSYSFRLNNKGEGELDSEKAIRDANFVSNSGVKEDNAVVEAIQQSLTSGANDHFTYGKFEKAIIHFHKTLTGHLKRLD